MTLRYSLRGLLIAITVLALWLGWHCSRAQRQHRAVAWLQAKGCFIGYDYQVNPTGGVEHDAKPSLPNWIGKTIGQDYFHRVVKVRFEQPLVLDDALMDRLNDLPDLCHLEGRHCRLALGVERRFAELPKVEDLELEECSLNDAQLAALGSLTNLRILNLQHNPFQGSGLASWGRLDKLETLYLTDTAVADDNLVHLAELENLQSLYLGDTGLGDAGLTHVAKISSLRHLSLGDLYSHRKSKYTNDGISRLTGLQNLERLDLGQFPLTVQNVDALETLPRFKTLWVYPPEADQALKERLETPENPFPPFAMGSNR